MKKYQKLMKRRGLVTWFDEERMHGEIRQTMAEAISESCCFVIFMTKIYEAKVNSGNMGDNCYFEFNYASNSSIVNFRIAVAMEPEMLGPQNMKDARFRAEVGGLLHIDMTKMNDPVLFEKQVDVLYAEINRLVIERSKLPGSSPIPPTVTNLPTAPSPSSGKITLLETLDYDMTVKFLIYLGCPDNFHQYLSADVKLDLNGKFLKHVANAEELRDECNLNTLRLPRVRSIFSDLQSFKENGISEDVINTLINLQVAPESNITAALGKVTLEIASPGNEKTGDFSRGTNSDNYHNDPLAAVQETIFRGDFQLDMTTSIPNVFTVCKLRDGRLCFGNIDGTIDVFDEGVLNHETSISAHKDCIRTLIQLSSGQLVSGSDDKTIKVWNIDTKTCERVLRGHKGIVASLCEAADAHLISASEDQSIKIWSLRSGNCEKTLSGHNEAVFSIIKLKDNHSLIASASFDCTIRIWNVETGRCVKMMTDTGYLVIQLSDGRLASNTTEDVKIKIWNYESGKCERVFNQGEYVKSFLQLSDTRLVSGSFSFLKIWNIHNGDCLQTLSNKEMGSKDGLILMNDHRILATWKDMYSDQNIVSVWK